MSFLFKVFDSINPQIVLCLNDIIFLIIICFYLGRIYENHKYHSYRLMRNISYQNLEEQNYQNEQNQCNEQHDTQKLSLMNQQIKNQLKQGTDKGGNRLNELAKSTQNLYITEIQLNSIKEQNSHIKNMKIPPKNKLPNSELQISQHENNEQSPTLLKTGNKIKSSEKQNSYKNQKYNQFLLEKIKLDGQKIQERGKFQLLFEKNKNNCNLIRKIQKHQIITDYLLKKQLSTSHQRQLTPLKKQLNLTNQNSVVQVQYYQNYQTNTPSLPIIQKRIYQLSQKSKGTFNLFFEHGKFRKIYRSIHKIGQGGFGVVYEAYNMIECKKYALKKIFINKNSKQIQNLLNQIKILNNLSHPNIVNYNTCWLEYAQLNQHTSYQKLLQEMANRKQQEIHNKNEEISINLLQNYQEQNEQIPQENDQQSYLSQKNSGFSFIRSSREPTKKSTHFRKKQSIKLAIRDLQIEEKSPVTSSTSKSFGLLPVMYIQMELCQHSLAHYIRKRSNIDRIFAFEIMNQLINGVCYIHTNRVVHRDLKPQNILFVAKNGQIVVKIGDFGLAINIGSHQQNMDKFIINNTRVGTPSYIAPELYSDSLKKLTQEDLQKADVYSLAVIYYEILNKFTTTHERGEKLSLLKQGKVVGINQFKQQKKFIQQLIKLNRPKSKDINKLPSYIKLTQTITQIKRKIYQQQLKQQLQIKDSMSTNNTQYNSSLTFEQKIISNKLQNKKQKSNKKCKNKNKRVNLCNEERKISGFKISDQINSQQIYRQLEINEQHLYHSSQEIQKQNSDQMNIQLYKANIQLIKRVSQSDKNMENPKANKNMKIKQNKLKHKDQQKTVHDYKNESWDIFEEELDKSIEFNDNDNDDVQDVANKYQKAIIKL